MIENHNIQRQGLWTKQLLFQIGICVTVVMWIVIASFQERLVPYGYIINGSLTVAVFFTLHHLVLRSFYQTPEKIFVRRITVAAIGIKITAAIVLYNFYIYTTGEPFEYNAVDSKFYHFTGLEIAKHIQQGDLDFASQLRDISYSDRGYPIFLGYIYYIFGPSIFAVRLINAFISAITVYYSYKLSSNLFGKSVSRSAAISILLLPNFLLYLGTHLKETSMLFLTVVFLHNCVLLVKFRKSSWDVLLIIALTGFLLFMFRTILGTVCFLSLSGYLLTNRPLKRRIENLIAACILMIILSYFIWNSEVGNEIAQYVEKSSSAVNDNMQFRASRDGGNKFALLAGAPLFLSIIFIAPFSSFVVVPEQELLWMFIGANLIRNIYAYFTIYGIIKCIRHDFKNASLLIYFTFGYFVILANSGFAISERFHLPVVPALLIFAAAGLSNGNYRVSYKYFPIYLILITIFIIAWNYIKLAGRGL